ncbi:MAG: hypothetical protein CMJ76_13170 [Planctomycetaceae bacterium]|nr:hypothetical protein [Planctomycetaceae bacterium]
MYTESKTPWWSYLMLITPVILIPVGIKMLNRAERPPAEKRLVEERALDENAEQRQEDEIAGRELVIVLTFIAVMTVVMSWIFLATSKYSVEASDLGIRFGYRSGVWSNRFSRQDILQVYPSECKFKEFGGFGIRYGFKTKRWGYICWSGSGVHIEAMKGSKQKRYVFSCSDPEACIAALNLSPEQIVTPEFESEE